MAELTPFAVRAEIHSLREWFKTANTEGQRRWMRLGKLIQRVRDDQLWKGWKSNGKAYALFDEWLEEETGFSKSKGYALLTVCDYLKLPAGKLEELGKSACYELARVGKEKPKSLPKILEQIEKESAKGPVSLQRIRTMVSVVLEGSHLLSGKYVNVDFLLQEERAGVVFRALKVLQAEEPLASPDGPAARGAHLISLCEEFLAEESHKKTEHQLEKAGAFRNTPFKLED